MKAGTRARPTPSTRNIYTIEKEHPAYVLILAGDHIYKMNYRRLVDFHTQNKADLTIGGLRLAQSRGVAAVRRDAGRYGQPGGRVPGEAGIAQAHSGGRGALPGLDGDLRLHRPLPLRGACRDATRRGSRHDFGGDIIPAILQTNRVFAFPFTDENRKKEAYWRDVGTLDAYYAASMDLISVDPALNMYDEVWPIRTYQPNYPPPKFVFADAQRRGLAMDSIVCLDRSSPAARSSGRSSGRRPASTASPTSRSRSSSPGWTSAGIAAFAGRSSTRASTSRPTRRLASTTSWTAAAVSTTRRTASP